MPPGPDRAQAPGVVQKYARVIGYALVRWPTIATILALTIALAALAALQPWPLKILIDYGLGGTSPTGGFAYGLSIVGIEPTATNLVIVAAFAGIALFAANAGLDAGVTWAWSVMGQRLVYDLARDLFVHLQRLSLLFHAQRHVGDSITRITGDAWCVHAVADGILISPVRHSFVLVSVGAAAWQLDPTLTLLTMTVAPLLAGSALYFGEQLKGYEQQKREVEAQLASFIHQVLSAMPLVQAFTAGARNRQIMGALAQNAVSANRGALVVADVYAAVNGVAVTVGIALVLYVGGQRVLAHELSVGSLLVFTIYLRTLETASRGLLKTYGSLRAAEASIDRVLEVLDTTESIRDAPGAGSLPEAPSGTTEGHLVFERVSFGYEPHKPVLKDLSLEVLPGETMALVGASGAGKSTLASLIPRFFDPSEGRILLDGMDIRDVRLATLRDQIAVVLQEPFLLPVSVAENIGYGRKAASRNEIIAAAVIANADKFIRALPRGYDSVLGELGLTLSGGERQRLAIARAALKGARVLILDEPTSALDINTERVVTDALERLREGRTTLIIAHRMATVRRANRIAVLEEGRIVEIGTHAQLLAAGGRYARLYALQAYGSPEGVA